MCVLFVLVKISIRFIIASLLIGFLNERLGAVFSLVFDTPTELWEMVELRGISFGQEETKENREVVGGW